MAMLGAFLGDQIGFALGRWFVTAARPRDGPITRVWRTALAGTESLIRRRGLLGVSVARAIPFVRTIMPWFAGRAGISWGRFLAFDILGILLWATVYLGGGFIAGESWRQVAGRFGEVVGGVVLVVAVVAIVAISERYRRRWLRRRRRR
jgi:membrane-associated protein